MSRFQAERGVCPWAPLNVSGAARVMVKTLFRPWVKTRGQMKGQMTSGCSRAHLLWFCLVHLTKWLFPPLLSVLEISLPTTGLASSPYDHLITCFYRELQGDNVSAVFIYFSLLSGTSAFFCGCVEGL